MRLPTAPERYSAAEQTQVRTQIERELAKTFRNDREVAPVRLVLASPNGARWLVEVDNTGTLTTTAL